MARTHTTVAPVSTARATGGMKQRRNNIAEPSHTNGSITPLSTAMYPGSKKWAVQHAARFFSTRPCETLVEAFAGSAVIGFSLLHAGIIKRLVLVEKDERIARMLDGIVNDSTLPTRYAEFDCTEDNVHQLLRSEESAFRYLVQTRCKNRAKFNGGFRKVIDERYCRDLVVTNIQRVQSLRDRITVICGDAMEVLPQHANDPRVGCFCDPPYSADRSGRGHTLYRHHKLDHNRLCALLRQWRGSWLLTEDNCTRVRQLARCWGFSTRRLRMQTASHIEKTELMIWRKHRVF